MSTHNMFLWRNMENYPQIPTLFVSLTDNTTENAIPINHEYDDYRKFPKYSGTQKICCNHFKI